MKLALRRLFSPLLNYFEAGEGEFNYRKSHRTALIGAGYLFLILSIVSLLAALTAAQYAGFIPLVIFATASIVCLVVGTLGSERAVATIWGSK
jgi:isoprenylcysteine carboxyl methyltransferase (ICMT) family protein YpbQ